MLKFILTIFLFLVGFILGGLRQEYKEETSNKSKLKINRAVPLTHIKVENEAILVLCPIDGNETMTKTIVSREAQFRVYADDGTYTLVGIEDWLNNTDLNSEFTSSKWMADK